MKYILVLMFLITSCSDKAITPEHVKMAIEACKDRSTWKTIEKNGAKLWVVCADDVPMNLHLEEGEHHKEEGEHHKEEGEHHKEEGEHHKEEGENHKE